MYVRMCDGCGVLRTLQRLPVDRRHKSPRPPSHLRHRKPAKEGEETPSESEKETPSASEAESEAEDSQGKRRRWFRTQKPPAKHLRWFRLHRALMEHSSTTSGALGTSRLFSVSRNTFMPTREVRASRGHRRCPPMCWSMVDD
jgi:hypothetical protein